MTGVRLAAAVALILAITAELVIGVPGLGQQIGVAQTSGAVPLMYALIVVTGAARRGHQPRRPHGRAPGCWPGTSRSAARWSVMTSRRRRSWRSPWRCRWRCCRHLVVRLGRQHQLLLPAAVGASCGIFDDTWIGRAAARRRAAQPAAARRRLPLALVVGVALGVLIGTLPVGAGHARAGAGVPPGHPAAGAGAGHHAVRRHRRHHEGHRRSSSAASGRSCSTPSRACGRSTRCSPTPAAAYRITGAGPAAPPGAARRPARRSSTGARQALSIAHHPDGDQRDVRRQQRPRLHDRAVPAQLRRSPRCGAASCCSA